MALTGDGTIGIYKLQIVFSANKFKQDNEGKELDLHSSTNFIVKVNLGTRTDAAEIADYTFEHYLER